MVLNAHGRCCKEFHNGGYSLSVKELTDFHMVCFIPTICNSEASMPFPYIAVNLDESGGWVLHLLTIHGPTGIATDKDFLGDPALCSPLDAK